MNKNILLIVLSIGLVLATGSHFVTFSGGEIPKLDLGWNGLFWGLMVISNLVTVVTYTITPHETTDAIKRWWAKMRYKQVFSRISFINPDQSRMDVYVRTRDSKFEHDELPFFINPKKAIRERGVNTFYFVNKNTVGHDFINDPKEVLKKIIADCKELKPTADGKIADLTSSVHEIWAEPYRFDARMMKEAITNAQLSAAQQLSELMKMFSNKNLITIAIGIGIAACAAALFGYINMDTLNKAQFCKAAAQAVINV